VQRTVFSLRLFPGTEAEYDRRHGEVWPELQAAIRDSGIRAMSGFRRGTDVWYYVEADPDRATAFAAHDAMRVTRRWAESLRTVIVPEPRGWVFYDEVFHTDGGAGEGPFERAFISIVIEPSRIVEYDRMHADPWPDMLEAIAASGYRDYSGFRRGNHVVYYGEYHPDLDTVIARMGDTEVNDRWGEAFRGIITTITDRDGHLITADEIYHQD
jgi:L-rhamnose mutarotase